METSAILAWLFGEPSGGRAHAAFGEADAIFTSHLTLIEASRAIVVAERGRRLSAEAAKGVRRALRQVSDNWTLLEIDGAVRSRAGDRFPVEPLRTLDAIHLATMAELREAVPGLEVLTFDRRILANLGPLGLQPF